MNNVIMSTKNTATTYKNTCIVLAVVSIVMGIVALCFYGFLSENYESNGTILLLLIGLYFVVDGIIKFLKNYISGQTYFDVYADRFIGKGMQNFSLLSFNIKFEEINNISIEKAFWIHIHTSGGTYKIMTDKNTATKVFNYYIDLKS
ncbi:MAG: hypothetical protein IIX21_04020 [Clostridia bacterium]|nr:hypothetical protein [Clostridia bacterium]